MLAVVPNEPLLDAFRPLLLVVAAAAEAGAVCAGRGHNGLAYPEWRPVALDPGVEVLRCGIGKANAAGAVARAVEPDRHRGVLNLGVCGALPGSPLELGTVVLATASVFADEGVASEAGFSDCRRMGFPLIEGSAAGDGGAEGFAGDAGLRGALRAVADREGPVATVSTCSGTDDLAQAVAARTGAVAEAMEGAAAALVCARLGVPFAELRVVSNTTGARQRQRWDLGSALARLAAVAGRL